MSDLAIWTAMGATAAATSALTGLTIHVANRIAEARRRPEADWLVSFWAWLPEEDLHNPEEFVPGAIAYRAEVKNCGDAKAFSLTASDPNGPIRLAIATGKVSVTGISATHHDALAVVEPGDKFSFSGSVLEGDWTSTRIVIDWITSPTRLKKHLKYTIQCSHLVPSPKGQYEE